MDKLKLLLIQPDLVWEDKTANLTKISGLISQRKQEADMILLPEMFTTGFSMEPSVLAESMSGKSCEWMWKQANLCDCLVAGSIIIEENGSYYNRFLAYSPDGLVAQYDKRHLFRMAGEESCYQNGTSRIIFEWRGWRILPQICYDIRFPVWIRNRDDYDLTLFVANWPEARRDVWDNLLRARALENQAFVAGVNRIGVDGRGINHVGDSMVISAKGSVVGKTIENEEGILEISVSLNELRTFRDKFPAYLDSDKFEIK